MEKYNTGYYLPKVNMKDNSVMIDEKKFFLISQLRVVWEHMIAFQKLQQADDYTTGCLLDYNYFNKSTKW